MVVTSAQNASQSAPATRSKKKRSASGSRKKLTGFNKFMQTEIARLKEEDPDMPHKERFKLVIDNWNKQKEKELARS